MKFYLELIAVLLISWCENAAKAAEERTILDDLFTPQYRFIKEFYLNVLTPTAKNPRNLQLAERRHKLQPRISDDVPFPCALNNTRSTNRPKSVHALRPGDIDVIGALGDSLTAGFGLASTNLLQVLVENRGISFTAGGQGTWREFLTIPNIIKEFNPRLIGYSEKDSFGHQKAVQFNAAEGGAISNNAPYMTKVLIKRIKNHPGVNIANDWKLISFMMGSNDFCTDMCYHRHPEDIVGQHKQNLFKVLTLLRDNLPRTIVNLIVSPHLRTLANVTLSNRPPLCYFSQNVECPCLIGLQFQRQQAKFDKIMTKWQDVEIEIAKDPQFDRDDFTVVAQTATQHYYLHRTKEGLTDYSVFAEDCFHVSQKEGARAALSIWNNLLEPVGKKTTHPSELYHFKCPSKNQPFIFTRRNSLRL